MPRKRKRSPVKAETTRTNPMHEARIRHHIERVAADRERLMDVARAQGLGAKRWHAVVDRPLSDDET